MKDFKELLEKYNFTLYSSDSYSYTIQSPAGKYYIIYTKGFCIGLTDRYIDEDYESEFIDFAEKTFKKITKKLKTPPKI